MDIIFNEVSASPLRSSVHDANVLMEEFLAVLKKTKEYGFQNIRVQESFYQQNLCEDYRVTDWLSNNNVKQTAKTYLMSICKIPFIQDDQEEVEAEFVARTFFFENDTYSRVIVEGLSVAFISQTLSVSFQSHVTWQPNNIEIEENNGDLHNVKHISNSKNIDKIDQWIEGRIGPILIKTKLVPNNKHIALRDDHGKDKLKAFSDKLVQCEYVISVVNSLPFNPTETNFIRKVRDNGLIEIVLTDTDEGFGLVVKTTGNTLTQTKKIAEVINDRYS